MITSEEIESAIGALPEYEFLRLYDRLRKRHSELWDIEIAKDAKPGEPLDRLAGDAIAEYCAGKTMRLP
jgi:hypothetical protein